MVYLLVWNDNHKVLDLACELFFKVSHHFGLQEPFDVDWRAVKSSYPNQNKCWGGVGEDVIYENTTDPLRAERDRLFITWRRTISKLSFDWLRLEPQTALVLRYQTSLMGTVCLHAAFTSTATALVKLIILPQTVFLGRRPFNAWEMMLGI